ncbi:interferon regulatory factor 6-like [Lampetra fluviatilis]
MGAQWGRRASCSCWTRRHRRPTNAVRTRAVQTPRESVEPRSLLGARIAVTAVAPRDWGPRNPRGTRTRTGAESIAGPEPFHTPPPGYPVRGTANEGMSGGRHKPRLGPWLVDQVDGGRYPGLRWLDDSKTQFRVPWPQVCRGDAANEPCALYRAWAVTSRKFQEDRDAPDPPKWKTNLRCALNKSRDFRRVLDASKETPPYKVYEWCARVPYGGAQPLGTKEPKEEDEEEDEEDEDENEVNSAEPATSPESLPPYTPSIDYGIPSENPELNKNIEMLTLVDDQGPPLPHPHWERGPSLFGLSPERPGGLAATEAARMIGVPPGGPPAPSAIHLDPEVCMPPLDVPPVDVPMPDEGGGFRALPQISLPPETDLELQMEYRGACVMAPVTVRGGRGCRLYSGDLDLQRDIAPQYNGLLGPMEYEQIAFPSPACITDGRQRELTERVLRFTERGLVLEARGGRLLATRLGQSRVFWSRSHVAPGGPTPPPCLLERETPTELLDFQVYIAELLACLQDAGGAQLPDPRVLLCFGEEWPDRQRPRHKKLIMVQVVPTAMRMLRELAEGAPLCSISLNSDQLQISEQNENDNIVAYLRFRLQQHQQQQQQQQQQEQQQLMQQQQQHQQRLELQQQLEELQQNQMQQLHLQLI